MKSDFYNHISVLFFLYLTRSGLGLAQTTQVSIYRTRSKFDWSNYFNVGINKNRWVLLLILSALFFAGEVQGQKIFKKNNQVKVSVKFLLASEKLLAKGMLLDAPSPEGTIDLAKYPDAKIRVQVDVTKLSEGNTVKICSSCYPSQVSGFSYASFSGPKTFESIGKTSILYHYDPELLPKDISNTLKLRLEVYENENKQLDWSFNSVPITIKNASARTEKDDLSEIVLLEKKLRKALIDQDDNLIDKTCSELNAIQVKSAGDTRNRLNELLAECDTYRKRTEMESKAWETLQVQLSDEEDLETKITLYKNYLRDYASSSEHSKKASGALKQLEEALKKVNEEYLQKITSEFRLEEIDRANQEGQIMITLKYFNAEEEVPQLKGCDQKVNIEHDKKSQQWILATKPGVTCTLEAVIPGVEFPNYNNQYILNSTIRPVAATYTPLDGSDLKISVRDGEPPYQLHFIQNDIVVGIKKNIALENGEFLLRQKDADIPGKGVFTLQIVDRSGNNNENARSEIGVFRTGKVNKMPIALAISCIIVLLILLILYRRSRRTIYTRGKAEGQPIIRTSTRAIGINVNSTSPIVASSGQIPQETPESTINVRAHPRPRNLDNNQLIEDILYSPNHEYTKVDLMDTWKQSIVSSIYLHERFIYRINDFIFAENNTTSAAAGKKYELGGWLLGLKVYDKKQKRYMVSMERFVPIKSEPNVHQQLPLNTKAFQILNRAIETYEDEKLTLVGWLHHLPAGTTPLTSVDIKTHETYFTKPFQVFAVLVGNKEDARLAIFSNQENPERLKLNKGLNPENMYRWKDFTSWLE